MSLRGCSWSSETSLLDRRGCLSRFMCVLLASNLGVRHCPACRDDRQGRVGETGAMQIDDESDPRHWLGDTPMLNLGDDKLRLRVQTVIQFSRSDVEKLRSICRYVASIPFDVKPLQ